jgi:parvulin-like peptidyl-prolyl isomerase
MRDMGGGPEAALESLIDERLLLDEARRRGIVESAEDARAAERVMVRAMLRDFEAALTPASIPMGEVRADFEEHREKLQVPEQRASWHILVEDTTASGRERAAAILGEVREAEEPKAVFRRYAARQAEAETGLKAEELPPLPRNAGLEKPYEDALFAAKTTGPIKKVIETSYGWHVVTVTEIIPAQTRTLEDVEDEIRRRLSQKKRFEKVASTVRALEAQGLVQYDDDGVDRLLSMAGLPSRGE